MFIIEMIKKHLAVILIVIAYLLIDVILVYNEVYFFNLVPVIIFIIMLALVRLDILYFIILFLTPVSIALIEYFPTSPVDFYIPTEPLLFGVLIVLVFKLVKEREFDRRIINHPVTLVILFNLFWIFITSITSSMPIVSFKFLLARTWFIATYYILAIQIFRKPKNITAFILSYSISMTIVIIYSSIRLFSFGFHDSNAAHFVMNPFFRDHTSYGAVSAMLFFALGGVLLTIKTDITKRIGLFFLFSLITLGLILSYSRAAWISVLCGLCILTASLLKIKFRYMAVAGIIVIIFLYGQSAEILHRLEKNRQDSSSDLAEHVQSISNITTDESNLERLNRWDSAFRMFRERPVFGWGPGTYMFKYAPFQLAKNKTQISTDFGDGGNAHSEYIGPLAESGILGTLSFLLLVVISLLTGFRVYYKISDPLIKRLTMACLLGLITYFIHGLLNNFLDTDKASALFWGFIAVFVSVDIYNSPKHIGERNTGEKSRSENFNTKD